MLARCTTSVIQRHQDFLAIKLETEGLVASDKKLLA